MWTGLPRFHVLSLTVRRGFAPEKIYVNLLSETESILNGGNAKNIVFVSEDIQSLHDLLYRIHTLRLSASCVDSSTYEYKVNECLMYG